MNNPEKLVEAANYSIVLVGVVAFLLYYLGIFIQHRVFPRTDSITLSNQFLLGIPISLVVVGPLMVPMSHYSFSRNELPGLCVWFGVVIEHGMLMNATAAVQLDKLRRRLTDSSETKKIQP